MSKMTIKRQPTASELEILNILWDIGPSTVRTVNEKMNIKKESGYTTTLKLMQIMHEKGLVLRELDNRTHIYKAAVDKEKTREVVLDNFLDNIFGGSAMNMVMQALGNHKASKEEIDELKRLIQKLEEENSDE